MLPRPLVWLTGDVGDANFAAAGRWLGNAAEAQVVEAGSAVIVAGRFPAAIVVFQSRLGRVSQADIARLLTISPFAHVVRILGPWCEGSRRIDAAADNVATIYWHEWPASLPRELGLSRLALDRTPLPGTIAVSTDRRESFQALADACASCGLSAIWRDGELQPTSQSEFLLIDGWQACPAELLSSAAASVLLLDWPRPDDLDRAGRLGISRVLAKPLRLADLFDALQSLRPGTEQVAAEQAAA